ncbi:MAG TPA: GAF domain-containing sensor histidine kinase, partial [Candidatus Acidoferrum sp.]|nr:GAF domain-containing sensor histidine kinase [Candidatus Acidoferrum sp.]
MADLDLRGILDRIVQAAATISGSTRIKLALHDPAAGALRVECDTGSGTPAGTLIPLEGTLSGLAIRTNQPIFSADCAHDPRNAFAAADAARGLVTSLNLPIRYRDTVLGALSFNTTAPRNYTPEELRYLQAFGTQVAIAIENARLYAAAQRELGERTRAEATRRAHQNRLETLLQSSLELAQIQPLERLVGGLGAACARLLNADGGDVRIVEGNDLIKIAGWGDYQAVGSPLRLPMGQGLSGAMAARGEPLIVDELAKDERLPPSVRDGFRRLGHRAWFGVPVKIGDRLLGTLNMWSREHFSPEDIAIATAFAAQAAIALENARLYAELRESFEQLQRTQDTMIQGEKLRALGQMSAGIAHDLNNMLAAILGQAELLRLRVQLPEIQEALQTLYTAATDGAQVVRRLQEFGRRQAITPLVPCDLAAIVQEVLELTRPRWRDEAQRQGRSIQVQTSLDTLPRVLGHPAEIREALTNLILNAMDAMPEGGTLTLAGIAEPAPPSSGKSSGVSLTVADTGVGMPEAVCRRIFEPFFTTKGPGGTGLGLAVVYGIMERHGGRIDVRSTPGRGTTFSLWFQAAP